MGEGVCTDDTKLDGDDPGLPDSSTAAGCAKTSFFPARARKPPEGGRLDDVAGRSNSDVCCGGTAGPLLVKAVEACHEFEEEC